MQKSNKRPNNNRRDKYNNKKNVKALTYAKFVFAIHSNENIPQLDHGRSHRIRVAWDSMSYDEHQDVINAITEYYNIFVDYYYGKYTGYASAVVASALVAALDRWRKRCASDMKRLLKLKYNTDAKVAQEMLEEMAIQAVRKTLIESFYFMNEEKKDDKCLLKVI